MKRLICMILSLLLTVSVFVGCGNNPPETVDPSTAPAVSETTLPPETTVPPETTDPMIVKLRANLPKMDGSTSLIPLEAGIRAAIFGKSIGEAAKDVLHTTSWGSFYNLLNGTADLIFSVPLSEEQLAIAAEQGATLESVPIAMEGFVFVVNAENPVDTLTRDQLRDIYSGRITNWAQVGGLDEEIIPYQRNRDSGSQNYMLTFMGSTPLTDAPTELRPASMGGLMDAIAVNDNSRAAIGYSVYAYAADMYGNGNEIKFIQVDGVAPCKQTFADGTYPLMGYNYIIFNAAEPEDSPARLLVEWILSDHGQTAVADAGYVAVKDIDYNYAETTIDKYEGNGTGAPAGERPSSEYVLIGQNPWDTYVTPSVVQLSDGTRTYRIPHLTDPALEEKINSWIDEQMVWVRELRPELEEMLRNTTSDYPLYEFGLAYSNAMAEGMDGACCITAKNGYLSVAVALGYTYSNGGAFPRFYRTETAVWDLLSGERVAPEALFCQGVDIDQVLNDYIREYSQTEQDVFEDQPDMKRDFLSLPATGWHLTHDAIYIDFGDPYFSHGMRIALDRLPDGTLVSETLRDFTHCIASDQDVHVRRQFWMNERDFHHTYISDGSIACDLLNEDAHPNAAKINREILRYLNTYFTDQAVFNYFISVGCAENEIRNSLWGRHWYTSNLGNRYLFFFGGMTEVYKVDTDTFENYPHSGSIIYNLETGEQISWTEMLQGDWLENATMTQSYPYLEIQDPHYEGMTLLWVRYEPSENCLYVCLRDGAITYDLTVPGKFFLYEP